MLRWHFFIMPPAAQLPPPTFMVGTTATTSGRATSIFYFQERFRQKFSFLIFWVVFKLGFYRNIFFGRGDVCRPKKESDAIKNGRNHLLCHVGISDAISVVIVICDSSWNPFLRSD
jgi:hypothetical protein